MVREHEGITCDRFEMRVVVGGGGRRVVSVQGLGRRCRALHRQEARPGSGGIEGGAHVTRPSSRRDHPRRRCCSTCDGDDDEVCNADSDGTRERGAVAGGHARPGWQVCLSRGKGGISKADSDARKIAGLLDADFRGGFLF